MSFFYVTAVLKGRGDKLVEVRDRTNARMQFGIVVPARECVMLCNSKGARRGQRETFGSQMGRPFFRCLHSSCAYFHSCGRQYSSSSGSKQAIYPARRIGDGSTTVLCTRA